MTLICLAQVLNRRFKVNVAHLLQQIRHWAATHELNCTVNLLRGASGSFQQVERRHDARLPVGPQRMGDVRLVPT